MGRYRIVPERWWVGVRARSSLHPIDTRTDGVEGQLDLDLLGAGRVNVGLQPRGKLSLRVERLSSGNPLEDRELRCRIHARRHPTIEGELTGLEETATGRSESVAISPSAA